MFLIVVGYCCCWLSAFVFFHEASSASATLGWNFLMNETETKRLLGIQGELYYVRNGTIDEYALAFNVPLKPNITELYFDWNYYAKKSQQDPDRRRPVQQQDGPFYSIVLSVSNPKAIESPTLNIPRIGRMPNQMSTFKVSLPCSGLVSSVVDIKIQINVSSSPTNSTLLEIKRKKTCLFGLSQTPRDPQTGERLSDHPTDEQKDPTNSFSPSDILYAIIGCTFGTIAVGAMAACFCLRNRRQSRSTSNNRLQKVNCSRILSIHDKSSKSPSDICTRSLLMHSPVAGMQMSNYPVIDPTSAYPTFDPSCIKRSQISLRKQLMQGGIGQLYYAVMVGDNGQILDQLLVKTTTEVACEEDRCRMHSEANRLVGLDCEHVKPMLASFLEHPPMIVYRYDYDCILKIHLQRCSLSQQLLSSVQMIQLALQVCAGLEYLHRQQIVHKDVAARNCLIDNLSVVRLTDASLSCDLFPHDYQRSQEGVESSFPQPIRWQALETLVNPTNHTQASDMWSFGMTLWEITTYGSQPYADVDQDQLLGSLAAGYRLPLPTGCLQDLYSMMLYCWQSDPDLRPTSNQLVNTLQQLYISFEQFV